MAPQDDMLQGDGLDNIVYGILFSVGGLLTIIFHKRLGRHTYEVNKGLPFTSTWKTDKYYRLSFLLLGILLCLFGILVLLGVIK